MVCDTNCNENKQHIKMVQNILGSKQHIEIKQQIMGTKSKVKFQNRLLSTCGGEQNGQIITQGFNAMEQS